VFVANEALAMLAPFRTGGTERVFADVAQARLETTGNLVPAVRPLPPVVRMAAAAKYPLTISAKASVLGADKVFALGADDLVLIAQIRRADEALHRMLITSIAPTLSALLRADGTERVRADATYLQF
jgi:hypothetical protein